MQFIKAYENAISEELIEKLISWSNLPDTDQPVEGKDDGDTQFKNGKLGRDDHQKFLKFSNFPLYNRCHEEVAPYLEEYSSHFPALSGATSYEVKLQKTPIQGGYSRWHCEQGGGGAGASSRALAWMVYLNDVHQGGETEFLYQGFRQPAVKGTLLIWPAAFTHTHRGNPPYSNEKYIITGWAIFPTD
jgi:hypothetical protein